MLQMDDEKEQDERTQQGHASAIPAAVGVGAVHLVLAGAGLAVGYGQHVCLHNVEQNAHEQADLHGADDDVGAHEVGCLVEEHTTVIDEDECVDATVDDEKQDEGDARQSHHEFSAYARGQKLAEPVHSVHSLTVANVHTRGRKSEDIQP